MRTLYKGDADLSMIFSDRETVLAVRRPERARRRRSCKEYNRPGAQGSHRPPDANQGSRAKPESSSRGFAELRDDGSTSPDCGIYCFFF